jgi:hypothetical protein
LVGITEYKTTAFFKKAVFLQSGRGFEIDKRQLPSRYLAGNFNASVDHILRSTTVGRFKAAISY